MINRLHQWWLEHIGIYKQLSAPIAKGKMAEIYKWETNQIIKLFYPKTAKIYATHEQMITKKIGALNLPIPETFSFLKLNGRFGIIFSQIHGARLVDHFETSSISQTKNLAIRMADLHASIHNLSIDSNENNIPNQRAWITNDLEDPNNPLPPQQKKRLLNLLATIPDLNQLCHGDFHPYNILVNQTDELIILDWLTATVGHPIFDLARTSLIFRFIPPIDDIPLTLEKIEQIRQIYLNQYFYLKPEFEKQLPAAEQIIAGTMMLIPELSKKNDPLYSFIKQTAQ